MFEEILLKWTNLPITLIIGINCIKMKVLSLPQSFFKSLKTVRQ